METYHHLCVGYNFDRERMAWIHATEFGERVVTNAKEIVALAERIVRRRGAYCLVLRDLEFAPFLGWSPKEVYESARAAARIGVGDIAAHEAICARLGIEA